ncbi:hypothetical protein FA15DRAFT_703083 [Coprinopsis marcescibilis]|uniref:Uncharacterized protein n=1 Tax=Coprinopsis marcescibilis TaxID=230819 RepID=A0A5C3L001_COPMA|nr:hypothetical protein FA15DRAFT_703083 [Coprinopsis marcescibilis]
MSSQTPSVLLIFVLTGWLNSFNLCLCTPINVTIDDADVSYNVLLPSGRYTLSRLSFEPPTNGIWTNQDGEDRIDVYATDTVFVNNTVFLDNTVSATETVTETAPQETPATVTVTSLAPVRTRIQTRTMVVSVTTRVPVILNSRGLTGFPFNPNPDNASQGTFTASINESFETVKRSIVIDFYGSAIQLFFTLSNYAPTEADVCLDGIELRQIRHVNGTLTSNYAYQIPVVQLSDLEQAWHKLEIVATPSDRPNYMNFDYAELTWDPEKGMPQPLDGSTATASTTSLSIGAAAGISAACTAVVVTVVAAAIVRAKRRRRDRGRSVESQTQKDTFKTDSEASFLAHPYPASDLQPADLVSVAEKVQGCIDHSRADELRREILLITGTLDGVAQRAGQPGLDGPQEGGATTEVLRDIQEQIRRLGQQIGIQGGANLGRRSTQSIANYPPPGYSPPQALLPNLPISGSVAVQQKP